MSNESNVSRDTATTIVRAMVVEYVTGLVLSAEGKGRSHEFIAATGARLSLAHLTICMGLVAAPTHEGLYHVDQRLERSLRAAVEAFLGLSDLTTLGNYITPFNRRDLVDLTVDNYLSEIGYPMVVAA